MTVHEQTSQTTLCGCSTCAKKSVGLAERLSTWGHKGRTLAPWEPVPPWKLTQGPARLMFHLVVKSGGVCLSWAGSLSSGYLCLGVPSSTALTSIQELVEGCRVGTQTLSISLVSQNTHEKKIFLTLLCSCLVGCSLFKGHCLGYFSCC